MKKLNLKLGYLIIPGKLMRCVKPVGPEPVATGFLGRKERFDSSAHPSIASFEMLWKLNDMGSSMTYFKGTSHPCG